MTDQARIEDFDRRLRVIEPLMTTVAVHGAELEGLDDELGHLRSLVVERADRQDKMLAEIKEQTSATNGRVLELERARIRDSAVQETLTDMESRARQRRSWWPSTITAFVVVFLAAAAQVVVNLIS